MKNLRALSPEVAGGFALLLAAMAALLMVNLGGEAAYHHALELSLRLGWGPLALEKSVHHWVNDGLMALFFLTVGIEIKRELRTGSLSQKGQAVLPVAAAVGGFVAPALVFVLALWGHTAALRGWSIPAATDIAFAVALAGLLKKHVPPSLRVFLLALAVADDLLAIAVIALFYTAKLVWMNLFLALATTVLVLAKNRLKLRILWVYVVAGIFMWVCVLQSGVHATVAGVIMGLTLPLKGRGGQPAPADTIEHALAPWVRWLILPLFAFANVGVNLTHLTWANAFTPLTLAIAAGLFVGKQVGVFGTVWGLHKVLKFPRPAGASWAQVYGIACLCGIGFTMSLFIGGLALPDSAQNAIRLGVLLGSLLSAFLGALILKNAARFSKKP